MRRALMPIELTDDIWWILDRYLLTINAKLRQRGSKEVAGANILGAIIAKFLIENQRSILDEFNRVSTERAGFILPRLGFAEGELSAVGLSADSATAKDCGPSRPRSAGEEDVTRTLRTDAKQKCSSPSGDARSKPSRRPSSCTRAANRVAGGSKTVRRFVP
jgi:hypothetical protein